MREESSNRVESEAMPIPEDGVMKLERPLIRDEVYATLQNWIVDGTLKPYEKVRDKELAEALGVSRTPVREALQRLEEEGLVQTAANRWTRVSPVDVTQAGRIYPIIWSLESLAISLARDRIGDAELKEMVEANLRLERALEAKNGVEASKADRDFHRALVRQCSNAELKKILQELKVKLRRLEVAYFRGCIVADRSAVEHKDIISALETNDYELAAEAVKTNWKESLKRIERYSNNAFSAATEYDS